MSGSTRRGGAASVLWGLLLLGAVGIASLVGDSAAPASTSARSYSDDGRLAALELLVELGFDASVWEGLPADLPSGEALLFLQSAPESLTAPAPDSGPPVDAASRATARDPQHYRRFVEEGGILVLGYGAAQQRFVEEVLGLDAVGELERYEQGEASHAVVDGIGRREDQESWIRVRWPESNLFGAPDPRIDGFPLVVTPNDLAIALRFDLGRGALVWLAGDDWMRNDLIEVEQNALFLVRLVERLGVRGPILFDEYVVGGWKPASPVGLAFGPRAWSLTLCALLAVVLAVWRGLGRREFPRDPDPLERVSPVARARGGATLLLRARRFESLSALLRRGVYTRLARRARVRAEAAEPHEGVRAPDAREVERLLGALGELGMLAPVAETSPAGTPAPPQDASAVDAAQEGTPRGRAWKRAFLGPPAEDESTLEELGRTLAALEREARVGCNAATGGTDWKRAN